MKKALLILLMLVVLLGMGAVPFLASFNPNPPAPAPEAQTAPPALSSTPAVSAASSSAPLLLAPISDAAARITKKPFGIYVSPDHSPVNPERFTGFHTGTDFETFPDEQNTDVPIAALCSGTFLKKAYGSGYGGYAVESCEIGGGPVTVTYGHLRLASIAPEAGDNLSAGDFIGFLGTGYSAETDGERKHLHLGIHKGSSVVTRGYVAAKAELQNWIDYQTLGAAQR